LSVKLFLLIRRWFRRWLRRRAARLHPRRAHLPRGPRWSRRRGVPGSPVAVQERLGGTTPDRSLPPVLLLLVVQLLAVTEQVPGAVRRDRVDDGRRRRRAGRERQGRGARRALVVGCDQNAEALW
jgi:hypothetical protein